MSIVERLRRVSPGTWTALFAVALLLPTLGSFGFWDPWELNIAERARDVGKVGVTDPTAGGRYAPEPPLDLFLAAVGMKLLGTRELGARAGNAFAGIVALLAVYWAGAGLLRRRAGLLGALALGTMPLFFLGARQLTSDTGLVAGLALAMGGLGRYAWPADGKRRGRDLVVGAAGCTVGMLAGGGLLGAALPCLALVAALLVAGSLRPVSVAVAPGEEAPSATGAGPDVPAERGILAGLFSKGVRGRGGLALVALAGLGLLILTLTMANIAGRYSILLGGTPRGGPPAQKFEFLVRQLGFGLFPWSALVVFALGRGLVRLTEGTESAGRLAFVQLYLLLFASFGFALTGVFVLMTGDARFAVLPPLALAIGAFLDEALDGARAEPVLGLLAATGTMVVARDFFLAPEELPSVHVLTKVKWPPTLQLGYGFMVVGALVGAGTYLGLATRGRALGRLPARDLGAGAKRWRVLLERVIVGCGRWGIHVALAAAVVFALLVNHGLVPVLSRHFSFKPVLESYARFAREGEEIGRYRVEGHGSSFYSKNEIVDLPSQEGVVEFLRKDRRTFALVASEELAALDAALKLARIDYHVLDASSSRFLLLSNRLEAGQEDHNPLRENVWMAPRPPTVPPLIVAAPGQPAPESRADWQGQAPPWPAPRVPAYGEFARTIELIGADYPPTIRRPAKIPLVLHFRVHTRPPAGYKVFVHFDAPGEPRVLGDHDPLNGAFPSSFWLPGEYIKDRFDVDVPFMTTQPGTYTIFMGFWPGGEQKRLPITGGVNDGADRIRVGTIEIR